MITLGVREQKVIVQEDQAGELWSSRRTTYTVDEELSSSSRIRNPSTAILGMSHLHKYHVMTEPCDNCAD